MTLFNSDKSKEEKRIYLKRSIQTVFYWWDNCISSEMELMNVASVFFFWEEHYNTKLHQFHYNFQAVGQLRGVHPPPSSAPEPALYLFIYELFESFPIRFRLHPYFMFCCIHSWKLNTEWVIFPLTTTPLSTMLWSRAVIHPERGTIAQMYHGQVTFDFREGHVTMNQPMSVLV